MIDLSNIYNVLHVIRNPYGNEENVVRDARLRAANEIERLQRAIKLEADYCQEYADKYAAIDPNRAARHRERAERLMRYLYE